jgi:hypothetical protein
VLRASSAGGTTPDIFTFYLGQTERSLPDYLAHAECRNPVPRTNHIAQSTLKASLKGVATTRFYDIYDLFKIGYSIHGLFSPLYFALTG